MINLSLPRNNQENKYFSHSHEGCDGAVLFGSRFGRYLVAAHVLSVAFLRSASILFSLLIPRTIPPSTVKVAFLVALFPEISQNDLA